MTLRFTKVDGIGTGFRFDVFIGSTTLLISIVFALQMYPLQRDVFRPENSSFLANLDGLSAADIAQLKLVHAVQSPRYDIGVFGNSRVLNVSSAAASHPSATFFNFAITGSSVRQSVAFIDVLAQENKVPHTVVISLDHLELQLFANPEFPPVPDRWSLALQDLLVAATDTNIAPLDRARIAWRHLHHEWAWVTGLFNLERLRNRLLFAKSRSDVLAPESAYRPDGSRRQTKKPASEVEMLPRSRRMFIPAVFEHDLDRLAKIARNGVRVIIYESPLEPRSAAMYRQAPSQYAVELRLQMADACQRWRFECHPAPEMLDDRLWPDNNHAPQELLEAYISSLISSREIPSYPR